ncbi:MAG: hypothetical protein Q9195_007333 [Heterodermia aff. obscurata]
MASHDDDGEETSPFSLLSSPYKRLTLSLDKDEDGDIKMTDGDEVDADEAQDPGSGNSLLGTISTAVAQTIRKFMPTPITKQSEVHTKDPALSPPDIKDPLYSKAEVQQIKDTILADSEPPISLRAHASLHPIAPNQSKEDKGDDIPLGTLKALLAARQHLEDGRDEIMANLASKWIEFPESSVSSNTGSTARGNKRRTLAPREDPKEVLMEVLYPGEGKGVLEKIQEMGKGAENGKERP